MSGESVPTAPGSRTAVIVSNHLGQPRHERRVAALEELGFEALIAGYDRGIYSRSGLLGNRKVLLARDMEAGRYHQRLLRLRRDAIELHRRVREAGPTVSLIWTFGLDCYLVGAGLARRLRAGGGSNPRVVLEIGDLRGRGHGASLSRWINVLLERRAAATVDGIVVTAPAHEAAFTRFPKHPPIHVHLNRMARGSSAERPREGAVPEPPFRLGVIGFFRYPRVLEGLVEAIRRLRPRWELHFIGDGPDEIVRWIRDAAGEEGVHFHGAYRSPADLPEVYRRVDAVWSVYDGTDGNVTTAIPNKLFESQWFGVPIVVAEGTALAGIASDMGAGVFAVDSQSPEAYFTLLEKMTAADLSAARRAALAVPERLLVDSVELLRPFVNEILGTDPDGPGTYSSLQSEGTT